MPKNRQTRSSIEQYAQEINSIPLLSREEESALALQVQSGCPVARDKLIRANLRLVVAFAKRFLGRGVEIEEIIAAGNLGLIRGVESFDPARGCRFSTYGGLWILQAMRSAVDKLAPTICIPAYMVQLLAQWKRASQSLTNELERSPSSAEIARRINVPAKKIPGIESALKAFRLAPGDMTDSDDTTEQSSNLLDMARAPDKTVLDADLSAYIYQELETLPRLEQELLRLCYGLGAREAMPLKLACQKLGITVHAAKVIQQSALARLANRFTLSGELA